ncbi:MAG: UDP-2,3-diacylglucosamine hydrolase [Planctomycetes bacterium]|nr:UDP-2,3-diacylglucosamine hydrolase [Planctomycetota bacterium]
MPAPDGGRPLAAVELARGSVCIGDLHLDASDAACADPLARFLERESEAPALVILGDLFEAWVGPAHAKLAGARRVLDVLAAWTRGRRELHVVPGNRDFLLGEDFERATGARLHPHGFVARLPAETTLVLHGDELCTLDVAYQRLKRVLRSAPIAALAPRLPAPLALAAARRLRAKSVRAVALKPRAETAQQESEVRARAAAAGADCVLVGHAHVFRDERLVDGPRWIVVDAFGGARDVARVGEGGGWVVGASSGASA